MVSWIAHRQPAGRARTTRAVRPITGPPTTGSSGGTPRDQHDLVLDLGCGSGEFTARLAALVPHGRVIGVDVDPSMLSAAARHTAPNLSFLRGQADEVDRLVEPRSVDLVVSRAMLHWLPAVRHPNLYSSVFRVLRAGGLLHLEAAGPGNVAGVNALLSEVATRHGIPSPPAFPDPGRAFDLLEAAGFELYQDSVRTIAGRRMFTRDQLIGMLRTQAVLVLTRHVGPEQGRTIADEVCRDVDRLRRHDGTWDQTFVRLEILARRPRDIA